ncbi:MAG: cysteine desulfurase [Kofleriaceae bacterium]|nr:cysteine desulfurase [Kofleriaceae bacterium]
MASNGEQSLPVPQIYLDNQATTRCDPRVLKAMLPYFSEHYGNAASSSHRFGWTAEAAVELAREQVAHAIGANTNEIVFCSGATEANNLAIAGAAQAYQARGKHIVVAATEHLSVLDCASALEQQGFSLSVLPVLKSGAIDPRVLRDALREDTTLVSLMLANNEIGRVQDIAGLSALVHEFNPKIIFHSDAAQALGKIPVDVKTLGADLISLSAHKIYGPKGVGALWRRRRPRLVLQPGIVGGGHEWGLRSGTLPVPLLVGFGLAAQLATDKLSEENERLRNLSELLLRRLQDALPGVKLNGSLEHRLPGNLNLAIAGISADTLLSDLPELALSTGSACSSAAGKASHVLAAIVDSARARSSLRIGLGRFSTQQEVEEATGYIVRAVKALRA